jgi:hypothetical protein
MGFYQFFLLSLLHCTLTRTVETGRGCVSLKNLKSQGKAVEVTLNIKEETLKTFVWILSKNSASTLYYLDILTVSPRADLRNINS